MNERKFSRTAIWRAVDSEYGDRLVEIAQEHVRLVKELPTRRTVDLANGSDPLDNAREIIGARIEKLRAERDAIIQKFEEGPDHAAMV